MKSPITTLGELLEEAGLTVTVSSQCRVGIVGDMCRCWRCRGDGGPADDETSAERDAALVDRTLAWVPRRNKMLGLTTVPEVSRAEKMVDARMENVVFLDASVYEDHGSEAWDAASGIADGLRTHEVCLMGVDESVVEAKARWRKQAMSESGGGRS